MKQISLPEFQFASTAAEGDMQQYALGLELLRY